MTTKYDAHPAQVEMAKVFSSVTLLGPPMSDKLVRLVAHLFTPEEAEIGVHLPFYYPKSLEKVARKARRVPELIKPTLDMMAEKRVIYGGEKGYCLMPLIPGGQMADRRPPTCDELRRTRADCQAILPQFRLCEQCSADIVRFPGRHQHTTLAV